MFDSHCHLHDDRVRADAAHAVVRAQQAGLSGLLLAGVDRDSWAQQAALRRALSTPNFDIGVAYGVHPQIIPTLSVTQLEEQLTALRCAALGTLILDGKPLTKPHAIGELGLDACTPEARAALPLQSRAFRDQLALARELDLPVVLHILRTHPDALRTLKSDGLPQAGGVVHSFSGSAELAKEYLRLGLHLSCSGAITSPHAPRLWAAASLVPSERLLVETDAPDQTPWPMRPGLCEPAFLPAVLAVLARLRKQTPHELAAITETNARRLFRLPLVVGGT